MSDSVYQLYYTNTKATDESYDVIMTNWFRIGHKNYIKQIQKSKHRFRIENDDFQFTFTEKLDENLDKAFNDYEYYLVQKLKRKESLKLKKSHLKESKNRRVFNQVTSENNLSEYKETTRSPDKIGLSRKSISFSSNLVKEYFEDSNQSEQAKVYEGDLILSEIGLYEALRYDYSKIIPFLVMIRGLLQVIVLFEVPGGVSNIKNHEIAIL